MNYVPKFRGRTCFFVQSEKKCTAVERTLMALLFCAACIFVCIWIPYHEQLLEKKAEQQLVEFKNAFAVSSSVAIMGAYKYCTTLLGKLEAILSHKAFANIFMLGS